MWVKCGEFFGEGEDFVGMIGLDFLCGDGGVVEIFGEGVGVLGFVGIEFVYVIGVYVGNYLGGWYGDESDIVVWMDVVGGELVV